MKTCCGEPRTTPYCPLCGVRLTPDCPLSEMLAYLRSQLGRARTYYLNAVQRKCHEKTLQNRANVVAKWERWLKAVVEIMEASEKR